MLTRFTARCPLRPSLPYAIHSECLPAQQGLHGEIGAGKCAVSASMLMSS